jgi:hypothetical protein
MELVTVRRSLAGMWLVLAAGLALGACSTGPPMSSPGVSTTTTVPSSTTTSPSLAANARGDVATPAVCRRNSAGLWVWQGTVTNSNATRRAYRIIVDFTDSTATVEQTKTVIVPPLAPGRTASWSVGGAAGMANIRCVIRSARFDQSFSVTG